MLSYIQQRFIKAAYEVYPNCSGILTRKQILHICDTKKINQPQWLYNPKYNTARGVFKLPTLDSSEVQEMEMDIDIPEVKQETDEEIKIRITETYEVMENLIKDVAANAINSLIITGGAGLGKSYTAQKVLKDIYDGDEYSYTFHSGYLRATHLFRLLWEHRHFGQVIVIDDCDGIFLEEMPLNILKAALELKPVRRIGWGSEKEFEDQDGEPIPRYFDYSGSIIFLTNTNIHEIISSGGKLAPHLSALDSRSLVLDLGLRTKKEILIKIKQTIDSGMLKNKGFSDNEVSEIVEFIIDHVDELRYLSLREVEKIAILYRAEPDSWQKTVRRTMFVVR